MFRKFYKNIRNQYSLYALAQTRSSKIKILDFLGQEPINSINWVLIDPSAFGCCT